MELTAPRPGRIGKQETFSDIAQMRPVDETNSRAITPG